MTSHPHTRRSYVRDFREECDDISALLAERPDSVWSLETKFKRWTVWDIIAHLYIWNVAAHDSLTEPKAFQGFIAKVMPQIAQAGHQGFQRAHLSGIDGPQLFTLWRDHVPTLIADFKATDPEARVAWAGPPMSAQSSLIARQMEHWAHAQAIYDALGVARVNTDRLYWIAELGMRTYSWSHKVRGEEPPRPKPHVKLIAPSGAVWRWNDPQEGNKITGPAEDFCQVVTQCRNVRDSELVCVGDVAQHWMATAQCFAGESETPPGVGERG